VAPDGQRHMRRPPISPLIDAPRQSNQQKLLRATIIAAIITTAATQILIQIVARFDKHVTKPVTAMGGQIPGVKPEDRRHHRGGAQTAQLRRREDRYQGGQGKVPDAWKDKPTKIHQKDRDASWTVKFSKAKVAENGKVQQNTLVEGSQKCESRDQVVVSLTPGSFLTNSGTTANMNKTMPVDSIAVASIPNPAATPIPAAAQILAAVVSLVDCLHEVHGLRSLSAPLKSADLILM